jgi:cellulose synthase/poly-beta-1,6-N-acetylglucosamine synthase-like glycosyltransferase
MQGTGTKGQHSSKRPLPAGCPYADRKWPNGVGLVSVIIPARNDAATVERTVSSVLN